MTGLGRTGGTLLLAALITAAAPAGATTAPEPSPYDERAALAYSQAALGRQVGDHAFLNRTRDTVRLSDYRGKPLVVNLVYTACYHTCPLVVEALGEAVAVAQDALGEDSFAVVTIGFDAAADTPERMRAYAHGRGTDLPNWAFLSGDDETIDRLIKEVGFIFYPSPKGFDHLAQTTVLDREGRVYRHVYGSEFRPPALVEPLKDLVFGRASEPTSLQGIIDRVRLFCTLYDPASQRYRFDYSIFLGLIIGFVTLAGIASVLIRAAWRAHNRGRPA